MSEETVASWSEILTLLTNGWITEEQYKAMIREKIRKEIEEETKLLQKEKPMTHEDEIRAMNTEELARFIETDFWHFPWCGRTDCDPEEVTEDDCLQCTINWLRQEADPKC